MTNQIIHEEISMLFCSEKFSGWWWWWWWRQAIIATNSRSRSLIKDLRLTLDLDPSLTISKCPYLNNITTDPTCVCRYLHQFHAASFIRTNQQSNCQSKHLNLALSIDYVILKYNPDIKNLHLLDLKYLFTKIKVNHSVFNSMKYYISIVNIIPKNPDYLSLNIFYQM